MEDRLVIWGREELQGEGKWWLYTHTHIHTHMNEVSTCVTIEM